MGILDMKFFSLIGFKKKPNARWKKFYNKRHMEIDVPNQSIYEYLKERSIRWKNKDAIDYFGTKITYEELFKKIDVTASAFRSQGIRKGDVVTVLSANVPEALYCIYARWSYI